MPFTPFHMGPGVLIKSLSERKFSLMVFGWSQIVMDIQPLIYLTTGKGQLHGFTHTFLGAIPLALLSAVTGKYLGEIGLRILGRRQDLPITWLAALIGAFVGTVSHVLFDGMIHPDMQPFWPLSEDNHLLGVVRGKTMQKIFVVLGGLGACLYFYFEYARTKRNAETK